MELFPDRVGVPPAPPSEEVLELARWLPSGLRLGTSSWSFPGWGPRVWGRPASKEVLAEHGLAAYAQHPLLRTVSVDRSYYAPVPVAVWRRYRDQVPPGFRFVVKLPAALTSPLHDRAPNPRFLDPAFAVDALAPITEALGDRLGGGLLQMPPGAVPDGTLLRLARVLDALRGRLPTVAVEPRPHGFLEGDYARCLADHDAVHVLSVHPAMPDLRAQWRLGGLAGAPALWIRWNLGHGLAYEAAKERFAPFDARRAPDDRVQDALARAAAWALAREREVVVIANNKAEGCAPATLVALAKAIRDLG